MKNNKKDVTIHENIFFFNLLDGKNPERIKAIR